MRDSFVLYTRYREQVLELSREQRGDLFLAILNYMAGEPIPDLDAASKMAFSFIRSQLDADSDKYEKTCEARRTAGRMGGRPKANDLSENQEKAKKANGFFDNQTKAKKTKKPDYDNECDNECEIDSLNTSCPEPEKSAPDSPTAIQFVLNDGSMYSVTENDVVTYQQLYPGIDCMAELRKIVGWCDANPKNRKTRAGAKRFVNAWLSRAQDRAPAARQETKKPANQFHNFEQRSYDYDDLLKRINEKGKENEIL